MNKSARNRLNRAVQELVDAEVAHSWAGTKPPEETTELRSTLLKARVHYKRLLDRYTNPVVPPTKKE